MTEFVKGQLKDQILQNLLRDNTTSLKLTKILFRTATWTSCVTPIRGKYAHLFHLFNVFSFPVFTIYLILVRTLPSNWWQKDMYGIGWSWIFDCRQEPVNSVKRLKLEDTHRHLLIFSHLQMNDSNTYIKTLLVFYLLVRVYTYLLICVDCFSSWCEVLPMANSEAHTTAKTFIADWVSRLGVPAIITTDRGWQFKSNLFGELMKLLGGKWIHTTVYHPESNGFVERFHRSLKSALRAMLNRSNWLENLPMVLLGLRTAIKEGIKCSSGEVVYSTTLRLQGQFFCKFPKTPLDVTSWYERFHQTDDREICMASNEVGYSIVGKNLWTVSKG